VIADRCPTAGPCIGVDRLDVDSDAYDSKNYLRYARVHARRTEDGESVRSVGDWTASSRELRRRLIGGGERYTARDRRRTRGLRIRRMTLPGHAVEEIAP
jgi:phage terminase Nu1 subunit (DNA packaging protein)